MSTKDEIITDLKIIQEDDFPLDWLNLDTYQSREVRGPKGKERFPGVVSELTKPEREKLEELVSKKFNIDGFYFDIARIRITEGVPKAELYIHYDDYPFVGIIYASDPAADISPEEQGTCFYKYTPTGLVNARFDTPKNKIITLSSVGNNDESNWEVIQKLEYKKNKCVIYNGNLFHSPPEYIRTGGSNHLRMTIEFFAHFHS